MEIQQIDRQKDRSIDRWMDRWIDGQVDRWIDGKMDRWIDGQMDKQIDGQTEQQIERQKGRKIERTERIDQIEQIGIFRLNRQTAYIDSIDYIDRTGWIDGIRIGRLYRQIIRQLGYNR